MAINLPMTQERALEKWPYLDRISVNKGGTVAGPVPKGTQLAVDIDHVFIRIGGSDQTGLIVLPITARQIVLAALSAAEGVKVALMEELQADVLVEFHRRSVKINLDKFWGGEMWFDIPMSALATAAMVTLIHSS